MKQLHQFRRANFETVSFNPPLYIAQSVFVSDDIY